MGVRPSCATCKGWWGTVAVRVPSCLVQLKPEHVRASGCGLQWVRKSVMSSVRSIKGVKGGVILCLSQKSGWLE